MSMYARIAKLKEPWPKKAKYHMEEAEIEESDEEQGQLNLLIEYFC